MSTGGRRRRRRRIGVAADAAERSPAHRVRRRRLHEHRRPVGSRRFVPEPQPRGTHDQQQAKVSEALASYKLASVQEAATPLATWSEAGGDFAHARTQAAEGIDERVQVIEDRLLVGERVELRRRDRRRRRAAPAPRPRYSSTRASALADSRTSSSRNRSRFFSSSAGKAPGWSFRARECGHGCGGAGSNGVRATCPSFGPDYGRVKIFGVTRQPPILFQKSTGRI